MANPGSSQRTGVNTTCYRQGVRQYARASTQQTRATTKSAREWNSHGEPWKQSTHCSEHNVLPTRRSPILTSIYATNTNRFTCVVTAAAGCTIPQTSAHSTHQRYEPRAPDGEARLSGASASTAADSAASLPPKDCSDRGRGGSPTCSAAIACPTGDRGLRARSSEHEQDTQSWGKRHGEIGMGMTMRQRCERP